ncbi:MATE family efflux transporter [Flavobacterium sp. HXWNR69]|jgi:O-antigen/teichoic acid export membrane protein|uniref:MATE family efflux transporter n=1 Tax=Flavobacterium fragile TaxID=2949085 RepID=A0ABT0TES3_9FLAO|nr:MATE family efflux transporter [Flavobacterium sp. HXWNR69]MCL9769476.1 MATE family efflux transporter [Flavobacterium sp. HXWNR69]
MLNKIKDLNLLSSIIKKGGIVFLLKLLAMPITFFAYWFIPNKFGEADLGYFTLALTILQIFYLIFALGLPHSFLVFTSGFDNDYLKKGLLLKSSIIAFSASLFPFCILFFGADFISSYIFQKEGFSIFLIITAISIPFMILHEILCYFFISIGKHLIYSLLIFIIPNVLFTLFLIISNEFDLPNYSVFISYVLGFFITVIIGYLLAFSKELKFVIPKVSTRDILKKSLPMMIGSIFLLLLNWTDVLMLGRLETEENIGIYNIAFKLGYLTLFFVTAMGSVIIGDVSEKYNKKDFSGLKKTINRATQLTIILTLPVALLLIFGSSFFLGFFGEEFKEGRLALIFITLGAFLNAITGNVDQILNMTGNEKLVRNVMFIGFVINVVLNLLLIPSFGYLGAAFSSLLVNVIVNTIFVFVIKKKLGFYTFM